MRQLLVAFALTACAPPGNIAAPAPTPSGTADTCGAKALTHLIGKALSDSAVPPVSPGVRHIRPGDAVTEDFRTERLNIYVTGADIIETITCG